MAKKSQAKDHIPQIVSIVPVLRDGKVSLKKDARNHLGSPDSLYFDEQEEILLTAVATPSSTPAESTARYLHLSEEVLASLELSRGDLLALIQRDGALALKKLEVLERAADRARVIDYETPHKVERVAETNPMPNELLPALQKKHGHLSLRYDARNFLQDRETFGAWKSRKLLGITAPSDAELRNKLIEDRLDARREDDSWDGDVVLTARNLRELGELGLTRDDDAIARAARWLLDRPRSQWNSGMFFLTDELVAEQARFLEEKKRFRALKTSEMKRVAAGDDLISMPCGPRIMWPNGLVLEALLTLGYEEDERVRETLSMMAIHDWCECGYQNGMKNWRQGEGPNAEKLDHFEQNCIGEYRYGGLPDIDELAGMDLTKKTGLRLLRAAHAVEGANDIYPLNMPIHFQGCEVITTRAMSQVLNPKMRQFAEAHLWRYASRQHAPDGAFAHEKHGYCENSQPALLQVFADFDHPASKVAIIRSLPWIVDAQNEDGSWGEDPIKDATTFAVLSALERIRDHLPSGFPSFPEPEIIKHRR
ncbi:MAG: hypothetical protein HOC74_25430 [Gemmatimonadetes bacterium]|jgi:hypothetical protein|nr:hypothetical protein [Gemmatimonadota bacterium]